MNWGTAAMTIFIPFVSTAKLITERTKGLKTLLILLGDGDSSPASLRHEQTE